MGTTIRWHVLAIPMKHKRGEVLFIETPIKKKDLTQTVHDIYNSFS